MYASQGGGKGQVPERQNFLQVLCIKNTFVLKINLKKSV